MIEMRVSSYKWAFGTKWYKHCMGRASLLVQSFELMGIDEEHTCINIIDMIFD